MSYPKNELAQLVIAYCVAYQIEDVVISPGSRNAPLTIGFSSHPKIKTYSIADERCAAFFAMGIAQQRRRPTAVVCTSGSALLNYYPAVAEAYYSDLPLIVISADRPKQLIDIGDGQTIRQEGVFAKHSLYNANLNADNNTAKNNALQLDKAFKIAQTQNGPVHINVPFDEPLYENIEELTIEVLPEKTAPGETSLEKLSEFEMIWNSLQRKMILVGVNYPNEDLQKLLVDFANDPSVIVLTETTSNLHGDNFINSIDKLIMPLTEEGFKKLKPEVLLTFGGMVVSKKIKQLLRKFQPAHHWHIDQKKALNTYFCLSHHFKITPTNFFKQFKVSQKVKNTTYQDQWLDLKKIRSKKHDEYLQTVDFSDFQVFDSILSIIPNNYHLQLGNSSVVRYAQLFDLNQTLKVFCNRGTSGIDGSTSTAIGASLNADTPTVFITGDISFFYDSNALWNEYIRNDFRILLVNNSGGGIFRIIPGPLESGASDFFETTHKLDASHLCTMFGFDYECAVNSADLNNKLRDFFEMGSQPKLLEVFTPREENDKILKTYFKYIE